MSQIPKKAKAMVLVKYGQPNVFQEIDIPELKQGDILCKVLLAGICGTDVHQQMGELSIRPPTPMIQGHETLGRIEKLVGVTHDVAGTPVKEGDRIMWSHQFCGKCYACKVLHEPYQCYQSKGYGFAPPHLLRGGFAEYEHVTAGTDFVRVPDVVTDEEALGVGCAFRSVVNGFDKLAVHGGIPVGATVVVQGVGPIGLYSVVMAAQSAASNIIVVDSSVPRMEFAKKWGATGYISLIDTPDPKERANKVRELTGGRGAEVVVEAAGVPSVIAEGLDYLAKNGKYLILGQTSRSSCEIIPNDIVIKNAVIIGSSSADIRHYIKALNFVAAHREKYPFGEILSKMYKLEDLNQALQDSREGKVLKACIDNRNR